MARKTAFILIGVLVVVAIAVGIILAVTLSGSDSESENNSGKQSDKVNDEELTGGNTEKVVEPSSDPEKAEFAFTTLAIGDWGATTDKPGSCCNKYRKVSKDSLEYKTDYHAQTNIAQLLGLSAEEKKPKAIIGHGDNIYWNGVGPGDWKNRMTTTFENVYTHPGLKNIPWINVVGNHDIGGSDYMCGEKDYAFKPCTSTKELVDALVAKFENQKRYKSPNGNRWILKDHYYKETIEQNGVSVDIFNVDTNFADSHAAHQVCCQCYGYSGGEKNFECNDVQKGHEFCAGGNVDMYDGCMAKIKEWWDDSLEKVQADLSKSTATYKVINTHYSPHFHMGADKMKLWYKVCKDNKVNVWMNGHTHGFNHDITKWGTHMFENGGGGGIQSETSGHRPESAAKFVDTEWIGAGAPYGFFEMSFSKDWLKMEFVTFDTNWRFSEKNEEIKVGGIKRDHCWYVPRTTGKGKPCA